MLKSIICEDSSLRGDITIMPGCIIHTSATIIADAGPIIIGENCIIEEYATIIHRNKNCLCIGANNVFEVGCIVEALKIGDKNIFESKCCVGPNVEISNGCIIGAGVHLQHRIILPENTVICKSINYQRETIDKHGAFSLQNDFLRKVLPNYHHLRKQALEIKKKNNN